MGPTAQDLAKRFVLIWREMRDAKMPPYDAREVSLRPGEVQMIATALLLLDAVRSATQG